MKILISNDDGITAPGIRALTTAFAGAGHEVVVVAPDSQRSAASHSMTLTGALIVKETHVPGAARAYAVSGTPVDCVKIGLSNLYPEAEAVISGVNHGYNAGSDVLYSGTVAAAMEGALNDRPAMAVSLAYSREDTYDLAAQTALAAFAWMEEYPLPPCTVLNVNYPQVDRALGLKAAPMKRTFYDDGYQAETGEDGQVRYTLRGGISPFHEEGDDDFTWLGRGYATMTVLGFDMTDHPATNALKSALCARENEK